MLEYISLINTIIFDTIHSTFRRDHDDKINVNCLIKSLKGFGD